jgi:hypothetical protein
MGLTLVDRNDSIYIREYTTYDRPDYVYICQHSFLNISSLLDLTNIEVVTDECAYSRNLRNMSNIFLHKTEMKNFFKFSQSYHKKFTITLDYSGCWVYGHERDLIYYKLSKEK